MKELKLTNTNEVAIVDNEDYDRIIALSTKWCKNNGSVSCKAWIDKGGVKQRQTIHLHRFVLKLSRDDLVKVDHKNRNFLICTKDNLRIATNSENGFNKILPKSLTGYRGVWFCPKVKRFYARIKIDKRQIGLGVFDTAKEAAIAYNQAALKYRGEFAVINPI